MTLRGSAESSRSSLASRASALATALLALSLSGCDESPLNIPTDPTAVVWTRITSASAILYPDYPEWRGDSIAFDYFTTVSTSSPIHLGVMKSDGTSPRFFPAPAPVSDILPRWVDDSTIVFSSNRAGTYDIWYLTTTTGATRRLTDFTGREFSPAPEPNSSVMAFTTGVDPLNGRIALIPDVAASPLQPRYVTADTVVAGEPDWSPTGGQLCFSALEADGSRHIWKMTVSGTDTVFTRLTTGGIHDASPRWSPDGTKILFSSDRTGRSGVWYVEPGGGEPKLIAFEDKGATIYSPSWSPSGKEIAVSSDGRGAGRAIWILSNLGF